jgi:hypothetical protein
MWRLVRLDRTKAMRRLGRRGLLLILSGLSWVAIGTDIVTHTSFHRFVGDNRAGANQLLTIFNDPHWGWVWIASGGVAVLVGVLHSLPGVRRHDSLGFNAILTPAFLWLLFFLWSFALAVATHGRAGRAESFYGLIVWILVSLFIIVIAGWAEATESLEAERPEEDRRPS